VRTRGNARRYVAAHGGLWRIAHAPRSPLASPRHSPTGRAALTGSRAASPGLVRG